MNDDELKKVSKNYTFMLSFLTGDQIDKENRDLAAKTKPVLKELGMIKD